MIYGLVGILGIAVIALCIRICLLKKSAREIADAFANRLK